MAQKPARFYFRVITVLLLILIVLSLINLTLPDDAPFHYIFVRPQAAADQLVEIPLYSTRTP